MTAPVYDLGGTYLRCGLAGDGAPHTIRKYRIGADRSVAADVWQAVVGRIADYERNYASRGDASTPAVLSFPGPIDHRQRVLAAPTLFGLPCELPSFEKTWLDAVGRPLRMINDVAAAAWYLSERTSSDRFLVVTVSSGIGAKLFDRQHPQGVIDQPAFAGEIGHAVVDTSPEAPVCDCGGRGHLGAIASGRGVQRLARARARRQPSRFAQSACASLGATPATITNEDHLVPAALAGDPWALQVVRDSTQPLVLALLMIATACGVERILVIGGFATALGDRYAAILRSIAGECAHTAALTPPVLDLFEVVQAHDESCLRGAAVFSRRVREGCA